MPMIPNIPASTGQPSVCCPPPVIPAHPNFWVSVKFVTADPNFWVSVKFAGSLQILWVSAQFQGGPGATVTTTSGSQRSWSMGVYVCSGCLRLVRMVSPLGVYVFIHVYGGCLRYGGNARRV